MHALQDSFSHEGLEAVLGQIGTSIDENGKLHRNSFAAKEWHEADDPSKRPALAIEMAQKSYAELVAAAKIYRQKGTETYPAILYAKFSSRIEKFCKEPNIEKRKEIADELRAFVENIQPLMKPREGAGRANPR